MKIFTVWALVVILTTSWVPDSLGQEPLTYQAKYSARAVGMSATAERKLESMDNSRYLLTQSMTVRVLGATLGQILETSQFTHRDGNLLPEMYRYLQTGISKREEEVAFDWNQHVAVSSDKDNQWQLAITPGILDKLSFQLHLRETLANEEVREMEIRMVDASEIETHLYRVTGAEAVETGLGVLDCIKVERIREPGSARRTTFWLARDWDLLLVKFEQTSGSGSETSLLLEEAVIAGQVVIPSP